MITTLLTITIVLLIAIIVKQRINIIDSQEKARKWKESYSEVYKLTQEQKTQIEVLKRQLDA